MVASGTTVHEPRNGGATLWGDVVRSSGGACGVLEPMSGVAAGATRSAAPGSAVKRHGTHSCAALVLLLQELCNSLTPYCTSRYRAALDPCKKGYNTITEHSVFARSFLYKNNSRTPNPSGGLLTFYGKSIHVCLDQEICRSRYGLVNRWSRIYRACGVVAAAGSRPTGVAPYRHLGEQPAGRRPLALVALDAGGVK